MAARPARAGRRPGHRLRPEGERRRGNKADKVDADELSSRLLRGDLRPVYHAGTRRASLRDLTRAYVNAVEDSTRTMLRLKARFRAEVLLSQLDVLQELRPRAKRAMVAEARKDPAWSVLCSISFYGPVRVSLLLATMQTPWRFRSKRNLWAYAGLAVVTESSADMCSSPGERCAVAESRLPGG